MKVLVDTSIWSLALRRRGGPASLNEEGKQLVAALVKAISQNAAYLNFTLQQAIGLQFRLNNRYELRTSIEHFHISDAFIVPSNPGVDEMSYNAGLTYYVGRRTASLE